MADAPWRTVPHESPQDPSDLTDYARQCGIASRAELSILEAENIAPVVLKYLSDIPSKRIAPFDFTWMLKLHGEMFGHVLKSAGTIRQRDLTIGHPYFNVAGDLYGLVQDLHSWSGYEMPLLEQSVRLHHRAVKIHPFLNGNGRWSRMLGNIWLKQHDLSPIHWPEQTIGETSLIRDEYIAAIKIADDGNYERLIELHEKYQGPPM